ncbi:MAG: serine/threonine protein kinase [Planctomycetaceae bacterium]|nr:serine/threonine protein kinase [Planctomycetaceae bacterium]MCA9043546.1 serine/threonine protein kinase [Planctomycetaceae bacterium]
MNEQREVLKGLSETIPHGETPREVAQSDKEMIDAILEESRRRRRSEPALPTTVRPEAQLESGELVGEGGLGIVYSCEDKRLGRRVALKVAKKRTASSSRSLKRFLRERELLAKLQHPAIPSVFHTGAFDDGRPYYVMRFVDGQSLHHRKAIAPLNLESDFRDAPEIGGLLDIFGDVCEAVAYSHDQGIVHRDIKPANIMVGNDGATFLVDWGLAFSVRHESDDSGGEHSSTTATSYSASVTQDGQGLGTPGFRSPEQAKGDLHAHGPKSDIFGLGAVLFYLLTGEPPVLDEASLDGWALEYRNVRPQEIPLRFPAHVPPELRSVCSKALASNPDDRYASARELKDDIRKWQQRHIVDAHRDKYTWFNRLEMFSSRNLRTISASLVVLAVVSVGSVWAAVQIGEAANRAEAALDSERKTNDQLFDSLEKLTETVMSDEILRTPELAAIREHLLEDIASQYQQWTTRKNGTPEELIRAAIGSTRLAEIEQDTGKRHRALEHIDRACELAEEAFQANLELKSVHLTDYLESLRLKIRLLIEIGQLDVAESLCDDVNRYITEGHSQLSSVELLKEQAALEQSRLSLAYERANGSDSRTIKDRWFAEALVHAKVAVERLNGVAQIDQSAKAEMAAISALSVQALIHHKLFEVDAATEQYNESLLRLSALKDCNEAEEQLREHLEIKICFNAIMTYRAAEEYAQARAIANRGIATCQKLGSEYPLVIRYRQEVARGYGNLAEVPLIEYFDDGDESFLEEAVVMLRQAADAYQQLQRDYPDRQEYSAAASIQYLRLTKVLHWLQRDKEAALAFRNSLKMHPSPELAEPGHEPNAYAAALGYALLLQSSDLPESERTQMHQQMDRSVTLFSKMILRGNNNYAERFPNEVLFGENDDVTSLVELRNELDEN